MSRPDLFIGVVTFVGTRFPDSSTKDGLAQCTKGFLPHTVVEINSEDLWKPTNPPGPRDARESLKAELRVEHQWAQFLGYSSKPSFLARMAARWAKFAWHSLRGFDAGAVTRLINIELSHLDLWKKAVKSNAEMVLILEDDAHSGDVEDFVIGLKGWLGTGLQPAFINVSSSFGLNQLEASDLLKPDPSLTWSGTAQRTVLRARKPVTNTVCAVLYGRDFLREFVDRWEAAPTSPVLPIDWKMNMILMDMFTAGTFTEHPVWWLEPAPIQQRSMA